MGGEVRELFPQTVRRQVEEHRTDSTAYILQATLIGLDK